MKQYMFYDNKERNILIGKIVCLARTYKKHAQEMNSNVPKEPLLFLKPASSVIFDGDSVVIPNMSHCIHHEIELGIIISKKCKNVSKENSLDYILGYCLGLDITARDIQTKAKKNGWPWGIAKGFDTFAPISRVVLKEQIKNPNNLEFYLKVNDKIRQKSNTNNLIFSVEEIIEFVSKIMTLEKGDLILTGTPEGVAEIKKGDKLEGQLDKNCKLNVNVI